MFFTDLLLRTLYKWRNAICLGMFFFGAPLIYMVRDGIGVAPNSTAFTFLFLCGPLFLLVVVNPIKKFYRPNSISYFLGISFILMAAVYLYLYAPNRGWFTNTIYETILIGLNLYIFVSLTTVSTETLELRFVKFGFFISLIGCLFFFFYLMRDPTYVMGSRASIKFNDNDTMGNPHIFARGAFMGLAAALVYLKYPANLTTLTKFIIRFGILLFSMAILLTQTMSTILATLIMVGLFSFNSVSLGAIKRFFIRLFVKWYFWLGLVVVVFKAADFYNRNYELIRISSAVLSSRISRLFNTMLGNVDKDADALTIALTADGSSAGRIENFEKVVNTFTTNVEEGNILKVLFGNGYHHLYIDIPFLEPLDAFGIIGQLFFTTFFVYISYQAFREMRRPRSITTELIAYAYVYFFIYTFTGGLLIDYIRWGFFILVCRFLPLSLIRKKDATP